MRIGGFDAGGRCGPRSAYIYGSVSTKNLANLLKLLCLNEQQSSFETRCRFSIVLTAQLSPPRRELSLPFFVFAGNQSAEVEGQPHQGSVY